MLIGLIINSDGSSTATKTSTTLSDKFSVSSESVELPLSGNSDEPVATVAETIAPSVVRIDTATGTGSGIIYDKNGSVVTNAHVVLGSDTVEIQLADGTRATGKVLGSDPAVDIAIVQIVEDLDFRKATFATLDTVRVGQLAVAIGSPFGLEQSVTAGIVSAVNRAVPTLNVENGSRTVLEMIQTDAPINPGNSGGALVDRQGRVVGMNTLIRTDGNVEGNLGVGFAIPTDTIFLVTERIANGLSLENGFLGISGQDPTLGRAGALVLNVVPDSPADQSGLQEGDLIIDVDGSTILGMSELAARIRLTSPGTTISLAVLRNGEEISLTVVLGTLGSFQ
jgi:putative serine protease PepD